MDLGSGKVLVPTRGSDSVPQIFYIIAAPSMKSLLHDFDSMQQRNTMGKCYTTPDRPLRCTRYGACGGALVKKLGSTAAPRNTSRFPANRQLQILTLKQEVIVMLRWALGFFIVALIAAMLGFSGIAAASAGIAKLLFYLFLILFLITLVGHLLRRP
jgi:uncharacterized membrane protein YtjA (UPF0391 family)